MTNIATIQFRSSARAHTEQAVYRDAIGSLAELSFFDAFTEEGGRALTPALIDRFDGFILGGSGELYVDGGAHASPEAQRLSRESIARATPLVLALVEGDIPTLGICFGHQVIAHVLGAPVRACTVEGKFGTQDVQLTDAGKADPLLQGIPEHFGAQYAHRDAVKDTPGEKAVVLARGERCGNAFLRYGKHVYTCQFHPELTRARMLQRMKAQPEYVPEGADPELLVRETSESARILSNFVAFAGKIATRGVAQ